MEVDHVQTDGRLRRAWTDRRARRTGRLLAVLLVGTLGAGLGLVLGGSTETDAGPFVVDLSLRPHGHGETTVAIPPLGELRLDTHAGPVALDVQVVEIREDAARQLVNDPEQLEGLGREVEGDLRHALIVLACRALLVSLLGSLLLGWLVFRTPRRTVLTGGAGLLALVGSSALALATFNSRALSEPRYTGLLASAPAAVGDVQDLVDRVDAYSASLGKIVGNMSALYATASGLPTFTPQDDTIRVLSVSDLHLSPSAYDVIRPVIAQFSIDVVVDSGDSTDYGTAAESSYLSAIGGLGVPYVWVRGNHDSYVVQAAISAQPGAVVLDGPEPREVAGLTFVGRGDPRFTPDKTTGDDEVDTTLLEAEGDRLREDAEASQADVAVAHEPTSAGRAVGAAHLVLAGHTHKRSAQERDGTLLLVQGSTGGAGLRSLESAEPTPVAMTVLYLDPTTHEVLARDDITLGGLGLTSAQIERTVTGPDARRPAGAE